MVSTFTTNLLIEKMGTGDANGTWGSKLNANFDILDQHTQRLAISVAGGVDVTLTATQARYRSLAFTGVLTGSISIVFPAASTQGWEVDNQTTGAFTLTAKLSGGTGVLLAQGEKNMVEGDGTNMVARRLLGQNQQEIHGTTGGTANAQTLTISPAITAYKKGQIFTAIAGFSNSSATTLAVSGLSALSVQLNGASCVGGEIVSGKPFTVMHDGSVFQLLYSPAVAALGGGFTTAQTMSLAVAGNNLTLATTDAGAIGSTLRLYHNTASPANADVTGIITFDGKDSGAADQVWANIRVSITDVTAASEDATLLFQTVVAGTVATRLTLGAGAQLGAPTGGDVANSINVSGTLRVNNDPAPTLAAANIFTGTVSHARTDTTTALISTTTDAGAAEHVGLDLFRDSATPAANDLLESITWSGRSSTAVQRVVAKILAKLLDASNTSEDAELHLSTIVAGTLTDVMILGQGVQVGAAPTGGDEGAGTINVATRYYMAGSPMLAPDALSNGASTSASPAIGNNGLMYIASGAGFTLTLPALASVFNGYRVGLMNECTSGTCLANRSSSDTIVSQQTTGLTSITLPSVGDMVWFVADKTNTRWVLQGTRSFESTEIAHAASTVDTQAHSLGTTPFVYSLVYRCKIAEGNWSIGDEVAVNPARYDVGGAGQQKGLSLDATSGLYIQGATNGTLYPVYNKTTGAILTGTAANWRAVWRARAFN